MRVPTRSAGTRSGVNWMRRKLPRMVRASVFTVSVFARPGTPSTSRWPCESIATITRSRKWSWPTTIFFTSYRIFSTTISWSEWRYPDRHRRILDRHREADADEDALLGGIHDAGDDADHFARGVQQRAAGIAGVRRGIELDKVAEHAPAL